MSLVQKITPLGSLRGTEEVLASGRGAVLDTGTRSEEWKVLKELPLGPKGMVWFGCQRR